jgi:molecular chaperone GrpE (heat shock protein)
MGTNKEIKELQEQIRKINEEMAIISETLKKHEEELKKLTKKEDGSANPAPIVPPSGIAKPIPDEPTPLPEKSNSDIDDLKKEINHLSSECNNSFKKIEDLLQDSVRKERINRELHEELQKYKAGLRKEFITPLLKHIIREYDRIEHLYQSYLQKAQGQGELFGQLLREYQIVSLSLLDLLNDYDIERLEAKEGEPYSAREHNAIDVIETADPAKDGQVATCVGSGFRDIESGRLLRQAEVTIYKHK